MRKTRKRRYYPGASSRVSIQQLDLHTRSLSAAWDWLELRSLKGQDFYAVERLRASNHAWLAPWESNAPPGMAPAITVEEYIASMAKNAREGLGLCFAILPEGHLAGQVSVGSVQRGASQSAAVGYWVASSFAGKGLAPLAVAAVLDWCLSEYGLHRVEINIRPENAPSLRVAEKLGIREEGLRQRYLYINGAWSDHRCFAVTLEEWQPDYFISQLLPK
ncbi:GNAT family N-acetyltransferase [Mobiluncus mulieris]|nr:GNAT family protein [Mobiluncus mulieris]